MKRPPTIVCLRIATACVVTAALWWFVLPDMPEEAVLEGLLSSGIATYVTGRLGAWGVI